MTSSADHENHMLTLPSSRKLGYATYGPKDGEAVFFFHGLPGTRLDGRFFAKAADTHGARIIAIDRPGFGLSTPDPERTLLTWADDVLSLADHLDYKTFRVFGMSGGGPYALACALAIPKERLLSTGVLAGMPPVAETGLRGMGFSFWGALSLWVWTKLPRFGRWYAGRFMWKPLLTGKSNEFDKKIRDAFSKIKDRERKERYDKSGFMETLLESMHESFKQGADGYFLDGDLTCGRWPFKVAEVGSEDTGPILFWNGNKDGQTPVEGARYMCQAMNGAESGAREEDEKATDGILLRVYDGEDHGTLIAKYSETVLGELLGMP